MSVFDLYSHYYDLLYRDKNYEAEAEYVVRHMRECARDVQRVLELGCGTAAHAVRMVRDGMDVLGVDLSESMLTEAHARRSALPSEEQSRLRLSIGDARNFRAGETFDAVTSLFHVLSYQTLNRDVLDMMASASAHLPAGAIFLFDFWYAPAVLTQRPETRVKEFENERVRVTRIARPELRENENLVEVNYNVIIEEKEQGRVERLQETHTMRYFSLPEIDAFLSVAGLSRICAKSWLLDAAPSVDSWSIFVVAQKAPA